MIGRLNADEMRKYLGTIEDDRVLEDRLDIVAPRLAAAVLAPLVAPQPA